MIKPVYVIRHKPTGFYMPEPTGNQGRGSSFWEPKEQAEYPRVFRHERSAKIALMQWLRGEHRPVVDFEFDEFSGKNFSYTVGAKVIPIATRHKEDMEVVPMHLSINP